jgi:hypothetical protein
MTEKTNDSNIWKVTWCPLADRYHILNDFAAFVRRIKEMSGREAQMLQVNQLPPSKPEEGSSMFLQNAGILYQTAQCHVQ